jgi:hypothetical protein
MTFDGNGTITGLSAGGLPDSSIVTADIADLAVTPAKMSQKLTSGTAVASTSGTSIDFTGIPSWVKRITVMFSGVSTNGTSIIQMQIGDSGGVENTGYNSSAARIQGVATTTLGSFTSGFAIASINAAADGQNGSLIISKVDGNTWVLQGALYATTYVAVHLSAGSKTLSDTLDRVRITTVNGTDTFDAGTINILYEG